jgi:integrase
MFDGFGLYLFVSTTGFKTWRMKYRYGGKEKRLNFGPYPEVTLIQARNERERARSLLREFRDPAVEYLKKKNAAVDAAQMTFERVAMDWHESQLARWSPLHAKKVEQAFRNDIFPQIGRLPITEIDARIVLALLRKVEQRGALHTVRIFRQRISAVFCFGIGEGIVGIDPAASVGRALKPIATRGRQPAVRTLEEARQLLLDVENSTSNPRTKLASRLLALTVVRPGIVRGARWCEFENIDWNNPDSPAPDALWRVPAGRMKLELEDKADDALEHIVPLPSQAVDILRQVRRMTGRIQYLFPSTRSTLRPMSENAMSIMYTRSGYYERHVPHGWRAAFSTIMNEKASIDNRSGDRAIIDLMLAHRPKGMSGSEMAYNRAIYLTRRREIAHEWAQMIAGDLQHPSQLIPGDALFD